MEKLLNVRNGRLYYGEEQIGESADLPGFNQYIFDNEPLGKGANGMTFSVTHKVLNVRQVIKIYFPKETENDISKKAKEESIKNANTTLTGIIAITFDAGEYVYPRRLWYSIMESVTSYCTIKEWRARRDEYFPMNKEEFNIDNTSCRSSIHTSINLAAGLLKAVIGLYENEVIHGDLNPGNILWILENGTIDETLKEYAKSAYSVLGELCPYNVKLIDMGASKANEFDKAGELRDSYKLFEHMKSFLAPLFSGGKRRFIEWMNFELFEEEEFLEYGVDKICVVKGDDGKKYVVSPQELAADFFRLVCVLTIALGIISNSEKDDEDDNPIGLDTMDMNDFSMLMYTGNIVDAIKGISFDSMITLQRIEKLHSCGRLINWENVWDTYPFNQIDISPVFNARKDFDDYDEFE